MEETLGQKTISCTCVLEATRAFLLQNGHTQESTIAKGLPDALSRDAGMPGVRGDEASASEARLGVGHPPGS